MKGLSLSIYLDAQGSCSNGGISQFHSEVIVFDEALEGYISEEEAQARGVPMVKLVRRNLGGQEYLHAEPMDQDQYAGMIGPMAGGAFIYTSDSRMRKISPYPIPLHDRFESQEMYDLLSR